jgi:hypothetical protein
LIYRKQNKQLRRHNSGLLYLFLLAAGLLLVSGCTGKGNLRFNEPNNEDLFRISGKIAVAEIVETELSGSLRGSLTQINDFRTFSVTADEVTVTADESGHFTLNNVPVSEKMLLHARSGKLSFLKRLTLDDLYYTDLSASDISIKSTAEALIWQHGQEYNKTLTPADIRAREYENHVASLTTAIKLALQLPPTSVPETILDLSAVINPARNAAQVILERETVLKEANSVFKHALLRKDIELLKVYLSPSFTNDWDSSSSWQDFIDYHSEFFAEKSYSEIDWQIKDYEFMPDSKARVRVEAQVKVFHLPSEQTVSQNTWTFDAIWRKEGSFWKIYRNLPYRDSHPTQVGADARWGEIAQVHSLLQTALAREDLSVFSSHISPVFANDWDATSTHNDLLNTTEARFNAMDVKIATYSIDHIEFNGPEMATVSCRAQVKVINVIAGIDVDSGPIKAKVVWRKEDGQWRIYRNLPYRFSHQTSL